MKPPVVVVYKSVYRKKEKFHLKVFENIHVDEVLALGKRKPLIPYKYEIVKIGVGSGFEEKWKEKYEITNIEIEESPQEKRLKIIREIVKKQKGKKG